jgi:uncharacterized membrane protein YdjX (TVP38/TMEM64 family)
MDQDSPSSPVTRDVIIRLPSRNPHGFRTAVKSFSRAGDRLCSHAINIAMPWSIMTEAMLSKSQVSALKRWLPLGVLVSLIVSAYAFGLHSYFTLETIVDNRAALIEFVDSHLLAALGLYALVYVVCVALSIPGAFLLTIVGGLVFGWLLITPVTVLAATTGAAIVFKIVQTSIGAALAARAGPFMQKLSSGFQKDAFNYLLFLRLAPVFPFFAVNAVAGLSGVSLKTFATATLIGIIPGTFAFAWLGRGLDSIITTQETERAACVATKGLADCPLQLSPSALFTPEIIIALVAFGAVALIPIALKWLRRRA